MTRGDLRRTAARRWRRAAPVLSLLAVTVGGAWLALLVAGRITTDVGPVQASMALRLAATGDTRVDIAPLGALTVDSHDGLLGLRVAVRQIDVDAARAIVADPTRLAGLEERLVADMRRGVLVLGAQSAAVVAAGTALVGLLVLRSWRRGLVAGGAALTLVAANAAVAAVTWDPTAVAQPRYSGLLANAPQVVGNAENIVENFGQYRAELAKIVTNVSKLYDVTSTLPTFSGDSDTMRVLQVSDVHLNPVAFDVMRSIVRQYDVDVVVDCGDFTDRGSGAEDRFADLVQKVGAPYVWVRGNHDSASTQRAVARQRGAVVLDGTMRSVAGLRIAGIGDPRYTPDRSTREVPGNEDLAELGNTFAERLLTGAQRPDIVAVHDPTVARRLDGVAPLLLAGHTHRRSTEVLAGGSRLMIQGSSGGAGLRALETEEPTPVMMSVLYLDRETRRLLAWDDITLGGLGLTSAEIQRTVAPPEEAQP